MDYKEQLKEALSDVNTPYIITAWIEEKFPELVESEDEQIRKGIIELVKQSSEVLDKQNQNNMIAWLEKQGYPANLPQFTFDDVLALQCCMETVKKVQQDKELYEALSIIHDKVHDVYHLEKQGEQKPINYTDENIVEAVKDTSVLDMVEPKFHEGEWISNGDYTWKIVDVKPLDYILQSQDGNIVDDTISHVDKQFHSFNIEDVKDGDVLVDVYGNTGIFQKNDDFDWTSYCSLGVNGGFQCFKVEHENYKTHPATKEQRDLLFQKMKESGYEWDAEKKELKLLITNGDFCQENCKGFQETSKCFADGNCEAKINAEKKELKKYVIDEGKAEMDHCFTKMMNGEKVSSAWSEEDDRTLGYLLAVLEDGIPTDSGKMGKIVDWLRTLKQRIGG